jgi:hypothetical protein
MTRRTRPLRLGAMLLLELASRILPASRRDWARDMRAELAYVESDIAALRWAFGCLLAGIHQRVSAMLKFSASISRPVLVLEWLMCFAPLTLLWCVAVWYIVTHEGVAPDIIVATTTATLGPIALIAAISATLFGRKLRIRRLARILAGAFAVMAVLQLVNAGAGQLNLQWFQFDIGLFVLCWVLPLLGCLHLAQLSRSSSMAAV